MRPRCRSLAFPIVLAGLSSGCELSTEAEQLGADDGSGTSDVSGIDEVGDEPDLADGDLDPDDQEDSSGGDPGLMPVCPTGEWAFATAEDDGVVEFVNVNAALGLPEVYGDSVAWGDLNGDRRPDLLVYWGAAESNLGPQTPEAFLNCPGEFIPIGLSERVDHYPRQSRNRAVTIVDVDRDGLVDIITGGTDARVLYQRPDGQFRTDVVWNGSDGGIKGVTAILATDFDNDGDLDLYLSVYGAGDALLINEGERRFVDRSSEFPALEAVGRAESYAAAHVFLPHAPGSSLLYVTTHLDRETSRGDRVFEVRQGPEFVELDAETEPLVASMGIDYHHPQPDRTEIVVTDTARINTYDLRADALTQTSHRVVTDQVYNQWGVRYGDFDNDGWIDMVFAAGITNVDPEFEAIWSGSTYENPVVFLRGEPHPDSDRVVWREESGVGGSALDGSDVGHFFSVVTADFDYDGCLDMAVSPILRVQNRPPANFWSHPIRVLRNECGHHGHWLGVQIADDPGALVFLDASAGGESPRGFIREVKAAAGNGNSNFTHQVHFGLGPLDTIDAFRVRCRDGREVTIEPGELEVDSWNMRPDICAAQ